MLGIVALLGTLLVGCDSGEVSGGPNRLVVGVVSDQGVAETAERYESFRQYLAEELNALVELEPVFNELKAVEQVQRQIWSIAFAPAGLTAIALAEAQYTPLFPLQGVPNQRSVLVVSADSSVDSLADLANQTIALGEPGSATGYYLPLYDLYGLTLAEIRFAPTPRAILEWVTDGSVVAGALSKEDFQQYRQEFSDIDFRVLHESRVVPPGAVLLSPAVERNQQRLIETVMKAAPASIVADAGYIPNAPVPSFAALIQLVDKVRPLEANVRSQPAVLTVEASSQDSL
ncbi:phosphate/phosphite/phosphonate ABC transporter substrate-binding protein [Halomicronema hongdechloris]|uniref:phosphate/phosphite/phosphonate ABC transporter substrate-binding protein n=1 Tax=Halomicronema hongdechloris TaxID=1209493 RepID=UPI001CECC828|nr:PhnD/SsuA/transferrin family substrate-binding protein [Halomicronema hongdechloris]